MAQSQMQVLTRNGVGKGVARKLRANNLIPAIIYGKGEEPCSISVEPKALQAAIATKAGWNTLITLKGEGSFDGKVVILKDLQKNPIKRSLLHADFETVNMNKALHVMVPVHVSGTSVGEKEGGTLQIIRHELECHCLPKDIPEAITVDVAAMKIGDVLHIKDIVLPAGVTLPDDVNFTVVTVAGHKAEVETEEAEAEAGDATA